jgi:hypothetical protein
MEEKNNEIELTAEEQYDLFVEQTAESLLNTTYLLNKSLKVKISLKKVLDDIADNIVSSVDEINQAAKLK